MTRRQFITCLLMAMVALALLPLQKFCEWGERWFGKARTGWGSFGTLPPDFSSILKEPYRFPAVFA